MAKKVLIIGGGPGGLSTAWELATAPRTESEPFEVRVATLGWRLGGKAATGRGPNGRIQEHGIHGFTGFYDNATNLLEGAYTELYGRRDGDNDTNRPAPGQPPRSVQHALIPDDYLPDPHARLTLYKRISAARNADALRELQVEMIDRFGLLPDAAKHLFATAELKLDATRLGIRKLDLGDKGGRIQFVEKPNVDPMAVIRLIQGQPKHYKMDGPDKLRISLDMADAATRFNAARGLLAALQPGG